MRALKMIDLPPVWLAAFLAASWTMARVWPMPGLRATGLAIAAFGLVLVIAAVLQLRLAHTTVMPRGTAKVLVTRGLFARVRNPIYLGDALILAGMSLYWGALAGLLLVAVFVVVINRRFIAPEEGALRAKFGQAFDDYCAGTRRWL